MYVTSDQTHLRFRLGKKVCFVLKRFSFLKDLVHWICVHFPSGFNSSLGLSLVLRLDAMDVWFHSTPISAHKVRFS